MQFNKFNKKDELVHLGALKPHTRHCLAFSTFAPMDPQFLSQVENHSCSHAVLSSHNVIKMGFFSLLLKVLRETKSSLGTCPLDSGKVKPYDSESSAFLELEPWTAVLLTARCLTTVLENGKVLSYVTQLNRASEDWVTKSPEALTKRKPQFLTEIKDDCGHLGHFTVLLFCHRVWIN